MKSATDTVTMLSEMFCCTKKGVSAISVFHECHGRSKELDAVQHVIIYLLRVAPKLSELHSKKQKLCHMQAQDAV